MTRVHVIDVAESSPHWDAVKDLVAITDAVTHIDVTLVRGPYGPEVLIRPRSGNQALPAELYVAVPGAFGSPAAFNTTAGQALAWASPNGELQDYLHAHQFGAPALPGGLRDGELDIDLDWTVQLSALSADQTIVVCQLANDEPALIAVALEAVDRLAAATKQSRAAGPQKGIHPLRFSPIVQLALTGKLDTPAPAPAPAPAPVQAPAPTSPAAEHVAAAPVVAAPAPERVAPVVAIPAPAEPADRSFPDDQFLGVDAMNSGAVDAGPAVIEALSRYEGKRVIVGAIADEKKLINVLRAISPGVEVDEICGFVDTGARANAKSGAVFTATAVHLIGLSGRRQFDYTDIEAFALETSAVMLTGTDGSQLKISTSGQSLAIAEAIAAATGLSV